MQGRRNVARCKICFSRIPKAIFSPANRVVVELLALTEVGLVLEDASGAGLLGNPAARSSFKEIRSGRKEYAPGSENAPDVRGGSEGAADEANGEARGTADNGDDRVGLR